MVMVSHAAYPLTKEKKRPASVSSFWVGDVLRNRIGYRGLVLSDDLEMGGVANFMPMGEAGVEAVRVGSDLLLICHHAEPILNVYEALLSEGERSAAFRRILRSRARESERKRAKIVSCRNVGGVEQVEIRGAADADSQIWRDSRVVGISVRVTARESLGFVRSHPWRRRGAKDGAPLYLLALAAPALLVGLSVLAGCGAAQREGDGAHARHHKFSTQPSATMGLTAFLTAELKRVSAQIRFA